MTLVLAFLGTESIWLLADRRLSIRGRPPKDDGCKIMLLETVDGVAILGYAGLGATAAGTQPSEWMSAVLRGHNLPLERSLGVLAAAMQKEFPRHLLKFRGHAPAHTVIIVAFVGSEARLYTIDVVLSADRKQKGFRWQRHVPAGGRKPPKGFVAGSGASHLDKNSKVWGRQLTRPVSAYDRRKLSAQMVAKQMAMLNDGVHAIDKLVGPRSIVAWRHRKGGAYNGGGAHVSFSGSTPESSSGMLPSISRGSDHNPILKALWDDMLTRLNPDHALDAPFFTAEPDMHAINAKIANLPTKPDEKLR